MQKREKILLTILIIVGIGFLGQKTFASFSNSKEQNYNLVEYKIEDLAKNMQPKKNVEEPKSAIDISLYDKDFFNKNVEKSDAVALEPILEEIVEGPGGFAAMISGNFLLPGDAIYSYIVEEITAQRVILNSNGEKKILERK